MSNDSQPISRLSNLASQLGVSDSQLRIASGALIGASAALIAHHVASPPPPLVLQKPDRNTPDTLPSYDEDPSDPDRYWTCDPKGDSRLVFAKSGPGSKEACAPATLVEMVEGALQRCPDALALAVERPLPNNDGTAAALPADKWVKWSYREYVEDVKLAGKAFMALGVEEYGSVTAFGFNAPEWFITSLGSMIIGGKCAGIYPTDTVYCWDKYERKII